MCTYCNNAVLFFAPECSNSYAKGYCLLDSFLMIPEKQFDFKTIDVTSGVGRLLSDSLRLVISLQKKIENDKFKHIFIYFILNCFCQT